MNSCLHKGLEIISPNFKLVLEFGVWYGCSLRKIRNKLDSSFQIFGFDSFEGLPEDWIGAIAKERIDGVKTGKKIDIKKGHFNRNGEIPDISNVTFYKGWFKNTLPEYIKNHKTPIGLIHIDCDLYSSTKDVLFQLNTFIVTGTILVFDDWTYNNNNQCIDGEQKAFLEWSNFFKRKFKFINFQGEGNRKVMQKLIKILR